MPAPERHVGRVRHEGGTSHLLAADDPKMRRTFALTYDNRLVFTDGRWRLLLGDFE